MVLVTTIREVLSIADAMERAAAKRYETLGSCMRRVGHPDLARVFESLAMEERRHVESVERLVQKTQSTGSAAAIAGLTLPETFGLGDAGAAALTPYKALCIAVRGEEEAFSFWTYVASETKDVEVRTQAEAMARQELVHAAKLRHERRRAYHAEKQEKQPDLADALDDSAMLAFIGRQEGETAVVLSDAADRLDGHVDPGLTHLMRGFAATLHAGEANPPAENSQIGVAQSIERAAAVGPVGVLFEAAGSVEALIDQYLVMLQRSEHARDLEGRCERATAVVARLNACLYSLEPSLTELARHAPSAKALEAN